MVQQVTTFQHTFLNKDEYELKGIKKTKKRVRYKTPTYTKSYTFCHVNPFTEELQYDGDERHIFRIKALHRIYSLIYGYCGINPFERNKKIELNGLTVWFEDMQAEITGSEMWSIKKRVKAHIKLLKLLRLGYTLQNAVIAAKGE